MDRSRWVLWAGLALALVMGSRGPILEAASAQRQVTPPTPQCAAPATPTPSQTEGPFYKANTPQRTSLIESGMGGTKLIVTGHVLDRNCRPIPRAWLDFWQTDDRGEYDNTGFRMRGHQFTDNAGIYYLETVLPGAYTGRTRHIHVKVRAPNGPILTSQLYFPGETRNQNDGIFNQRLLVAMQDAPAGGRVALFNFVVETR